MAPPPPPLPTDFSKRTTFKDELARLRQLPKDKQAEVIAGIERDSAEFLGSRPHPSVTQQGGHLDFKIYEDDETAAEHAGSLEATKMEAEHEGRRNLRKMGFKVVVNKTANPQSVPGRPGVITGAGADAPLTSDPRFKKRADYGIIKFGAGPDPPLTSGPRFKNMALLGELTFGSVKPDVL